MVGFAYDYAIKRMRKVYCMCDTQIKLTYRHILRCSEWATWHNASPNKAFAELSDLDEFLSKDVEEVLQHDLKADAEKLLAKISSHVSI
jgi:hypothetical protein